MVMLLALYLCSVEYVMLCYIKNNNGATTSLWHSSNCLTPLRITANIAAEYCMTKFTVATILKNKGDDVVIGGKSN